MEASMIVSARLALRSAGLVCMLATLTAACGDDAASDSDPGAGRDGGPDGGGQAGSGGKDDGGKRDAGDPPSDGGATPDASGPASVCGDGVVEGGEDCDDENEEDGDGCDGACAFESGWSCSTDEPTECEPRCGDGRLVGAELEAGGCDDANGDTGDGCDDDCEVEPGFVCTDAPSECSPTCGDGVIDDGESCDDGNDDAGDGCNACSEEEGWSCAGEPSECSAALDADVVIGGTQLAALSTRDPGAIGPATVLTGLVAGDTLAAIDRRPINGMLYGLGFNATAGTVQLYLVGTASGLCTPIGAPASFVDSSATPVPVAGPQLDIDFNPTVDRVRVVTSAGQSFRMNPNNGAAVDGDGASAGIQMDGPINGATTTVQACAYTNNSAGQTVTTLLTIDQNSDALYVQNPPNSGLQTLPQAIAPVIDFVRSFDVPAGVDVAIANSAPTSGTGFAVVELPDEDDAFFASVDLATGDLGATTAIGPDVVSLAVQRGADQVLIGLSSNGQALRRFTRATPGTVTDVDLSGVVAGEVIVGIDWRPHTGQLYGLGINATANTGTVYLIDPQVGAVTTVGVIAGLIALVDATATPVDLPDPSAGWGFDFNPMVDRIRVVTGTGLNLRINPNSGAPVDGDGGATPGINPDGAINGLAGGSTGLTAAAYVNTYPGATVTALYTLDPTANGLYILNPPNAGVAGNFVAITLDGQPLDFTAASGFDIAPIARTNDLTTVADSIGYAALTVGGLAHLYAIELATGAATDLGQIGDGSALSGLAVGSAQ
jgi:cysteine-rich repeat protein